MASCAPVTAVIPLPKGVYPRTAENSPRPREYPPDIISLVVGMYESGRTVREVQEAIPSGYKAQRIIERHVPTRRPAAKRNQRGAANHMWKAQPGYGAVHLRLGRASRHVCADCGGAASDWSYIGGCADEMTGHHGSPYCVHRHHYEPRCKQCHSIYDDKGRRPNGQFVTREEAQS